MLSCFEHSVESDEKLSHAGDLDDEVRFSRVFESFGERNENGVTPPGGEGRHIERRSDLGSSACDATSALEFPAIVVVGRESPECCDLGSVDGPQFGDFCEELVGGIFSDARYAAQNIAFRFPIIIGVEEIRDGLFDDFQLLVEQGDRLLNTLLWDFSAGGVLSIFLDRSQLDNLSSSGDEILQFLLVFRCFGSQHGSNDFGELRQVSGVNWICLGPMSEPFCEVASLSGIDDGHGEIRIDENADQSSFITSGGLDDEELECGELAELFQELVESFRIIFESPLFRQGSNVHVKLIFGDINPNKYGWRSGVSRDGADPVLQMRTRGGGSRDTVLAAVRAGTRGDAAIMLRDGVLITKAQSICRTPWSRRLFACAQRRWLHGLHYTTFTSV